MPTKNGGYDGATKIPAWEMIRFSVNIMRGWCFGGCTFCLITEHEGRSFEPSEDSVIKEVEAIRDSSRVSPAPFPTCGPDRQHKITGCKCRRSNRPVAKPSCVYLGICANPNTDHSALVHIPRVRSRA
jgi:radical SAM superfamily enzyme YgiQ (UPF0313 family)